MNRALLLGAPVTGISTGIGDLDFLTGGLQQGELIIIGGRHSMGKTAIALTIAAHVSASCKLPAVIFSLDLSGAQVAVRLISLFGQIELPRVHSGNMDPDELRRARQAIGKLEEATLFVDDSREVSLAKLRRRARKLKRKHPDLSLIVVDYLQLLRIPGVDEIHSGKISSVGNALKRLARELNVAVIALSQVSRQVESRCDKRPLLGDLIGSDDIEEQADTVAMLYRDEYYVKGSPDRGVVELTIVKQKNGPTGTIRLGFREAYACIEDRPPMREADLRQSE